MNHATRIPVVALTPGAHHYARQFWQQQRHPAKAKQVYLNTLAVWAVQRYLQSQGILCDRDASASWDPIQQTLADIASLDLPGWGTLECRPVLPEATVCTVPPEVWGDRQGYLAIRLNRELTEARLLGWAPVANGDLPLAELQPLAALVALIVPTTEPYADEAS